MHPQIRDILDMATQAGGVYLETNLSIPVGEWVPGRPGCIYVSASYHPSQVALDDFLAYLEAAREAGLVVVPQIVAHPSYLPIDSVRAAFTERGFALGCRRFRGTWEDRMFPKQYTDSERAAFGLPQNDPAPSPLPPSLDNCIAGWRTLAIRQDTRVARCPHLWKYPELTDLLPGPAPCPEEACPGSLLSHDTRVFLPVIERAREILERKNNESG